MVEFDGDRMIAVFGAPEELAHKERAEGAAAGFEGRVDVPIRGRREAQDLFAMPVPREPACLPFRVLLWANPKS